jgi:hypothetical protein
VCGLSASTQSTSTRRRTRRTQGRGSRCTGSSPRPAGPSSRTSPAWNGSTSPTSGAHSASELSNSPGSQPPRLGERHRTDSSIVQPAGRSSSE